VASTRLDARRSHLPVLLTSGYSEATKANAEAEGIRVLPKPYGLEHLATALRATLKDKGSAAPVSARKTVAVTKPGRSQRCSNGDISPLYLRVPIV